MKKVVSLLLVVVLALGMATVGFAKRSDAIDSFKLTGKSASKDLGDVRPGDEKIAHEFKLADFTYDDEVAADPTAVPPVVYDMGGPSALSKKFMKDSKVTIKNTTRSGSKVLDEIAWVDYNGTAAIQIAFIDPFVSTGDIDFEFHIYLVIDGTRSDSDFYVDVTGNFANNETTVDADSDYVDLADGMVVEAEAYIKDIEVDLGNEVYINAKMFNGKKYYGISELDPEESDDAITSKYPSIDTVITLKTVGLNAAGNTVNLSGYGSDYYVYGKDMKYLGKSGDKLEYSTKYYLSSSELEIADAGDDEPGEEPEDGDGDPELGPDTGGDGDYVANANDNPGTGK